MSHPFSNSPEFLRVVPLCVSYHVWPAANVRRCGCGAMASFSHSASRDARGAFDNRNWQQTFATPAIAPTTTNASRMRQARPGSRRYAHPSR